MYIWRVQSFFALFNFWKFLYLICILPFDIILLRKIRKQQMKIHSVILETGFPSWNTTQTSARFQTFLLSAPKLMCIRAERLVCTQLCTWARSVAQVQQNLVCLHVRHIKTAGLCPCGCEIPLGCVWHEDGGHRTGGLTHTKGTRR